MSQRQPGEPSAIPFKELQMSRYALAFMLIALACWTGAFTLVPNLPTLEIALQLLGGVACVGLLLALIKGRRIKFDPLLR